MKFIGSFRDGDRIQDIYLCKARTQATAKNGKPYENVTLTDKTGTVYCKIWDPNSSGIEEFSEMDFVHITGEVVTFNGNVQLNIRRARRASQDEYLPGDYIPTTEKDVEELKARKEAVREKRHKRLEKERAARKRKKAAARATAYSSKES